MKEFLKTHLHESLLLLFLAGFMVTYYLIPKIIKLVNHKNLMDAPNNRSSHKKLTPTFGGVAFYIVLVLSLLLINVFESMNLSLYILAALSVLLFVGLKDDLVVISYKTKLFGQLCAVLIFLFSTDFYQVNLNGFLGFYELNFYWGSLVSIIIALSIINAINLIDGVDGLASSTSIIILTIYSLIFYVTKQYFFVLLSLSLVGSLLAFLRFNLSSKNKIFMGDTGSLILGFVISILTLRFLGLENYEFQEVNFIAKNAPFYALSILIFPIFDMFRIVIVRLKNKKHPLLADKNHTHHVLLDLGNSHIKTSLKICFITFLATLTLIYLTMKIDNFWMLALIFIVFFASFMWIFSRLSIKRENI